MFKKRYIYSLLLFFSCISLNSFAFKQEGVSEAQSPVKMSLQAEKDIIKEGEIFRVGVLFDIEDESFLYAKNPGASGIPLKIKWHVPLGYKLEKEHWPTPQVLQENNNYYFKYANRIFIIAEFLAPKTFSKEEVYIEVEASWLACNTGCFLDEQNSKIGIDDKGIINSKEQVNEKLFSLSNENPSLIKKDFSTKVNIELEEGNLVIEFPKNSISSKEENTVIMMDVEEIIDYTKPQKKIIKDKSVIISVPLLDGKKIRSLKEIKFSILTQDSKGNSIQALEVEKKLNDVNPSLTKKDFSFGKYCLFILAAFLGGLILNVMPCVLPLLSLKVYGLLKNSKESRSFVIKHGIFFASGVLASFWLLATLGVILKSLGHTVGWGFQLQEPIFVMSLVLIFFLFALSSLGVFEMRNFFSGAERTFENKKQGIGLFLTSFFNGILTVLVTTPCSGPFLGPILGLALVLPLVKQLFFFTAVGMGMALPYLIFSCFPVLIKFLPKPGKWMETFKQVMGFFILGTVIWLLWIFSSLTEGNSSSVNLLLLGLLVVGIGAWVLGRWGGILSRRVIRKMASVGCLLCISCGFYLGIRASSFVPKENFMATNNEQTFPWEPFSLERVRELRSEGKMIFVDFTAKWCLTCQTNKAILHKEDTLKLFEKNNVVFMIADWTKKDPKVAEELQKLGRGSVPVYALYPGNLEEEVIILPQNLTYKIIEKTITSTLLKR